MQMQVLPLQGLPPLTAPGVPLQEAALHPPYWHEPPFREPRCVSAITTPVSGTLPWQPQR